VATAVEPAVAVVVQDSTIWATIKAPDALGTDSLTSRQDCALMVTRAWLSLWQTVKVGSGSPDGPVRMSYVPPAGSVMEAPPGAGTVWPPLMAPEQVPAAAVPEGVELAMAVAVRVAVGDGS
jgi:hypothetical protein